MEYKKKTLLNLLEKELFHYQKNEDKKIGEEKVYMQQANTIREWYQKLNFLPNLELDDNSFEENEDDEKYENLNWVENSNDINSEEKKFFSLLK